MTLSVHDLKDPRRSTIVRIAREHFVTHGYTASRMEPVARQSGVSTATLYSFFESKPTLFEAVIGNATDEFSERMTSLPTCTGSARDRLNTFVGAYSGLMNDPDVRAIFRLILAERHRFEALATQFFNRGRSMFGSALVAMIDDLCSKGELKVEWPASAAGQLMGMIEHPIFFMPLIAADETSLDPQWVAEDAVETFLARYVG